MELNEPAWLPSLKEAISMKLKTNLHFHTGDDPHDYVPYTTTAGIDHAASLGFEVLAVTCHGKMAWNEEYNQFAAKQNILLIPGIELDVTSSRQEERRGKHVIVLNCGTDIEAVRTFGDLREYRRAHPDIFVLAPHPYFYGHFSLKDFLAQNVDLFDAIEHSWFYSAGFNRNTPAQQFANAHRLPLIATSDAHTFQNLDTDYAVACAEEKTIPGVLEAIRNGRIENVTRQKHLMKEMVLPVGVFFAKNMWHRRGYL